jgi:hypothetical protein
MFNKKKPKEKYVQWRKNTHHNNGLCTDCQKPFEVGQLVVERLKSIERNEYKDYIDINYLFSLEHLIHTSADGIRSK